MAFRLKEFELSQVQIGIFFIVMPIFYIPTSIYVQQVPNGVKKRAILIVASLLSFVSNLFVGPTTAFGMPDSIFLMILGQAMRGCTDPFTLVPCLPEMIECVLPHYPASAEMEINNLASGMFNMFLGIGQVIGPLFGAEMTKRYGFRTCCDCVAIICLIYSIAYYVICDGKKAFIESRWINYEEDIVYDLDGTSCAHIP